MARKREALRCPDDANRPDPNCAYKDTVEILDFIRRKDAGKVLIRDEYGRQANPTQRVADRKVAALEASDQALLFANRVKRPRSRLRDFFQTKTVCTQRSLRTIFRPFIPTASCGASCRFPVSAITTRLPGLPSSDDHVIMSKGAYRQTDEFARECLPRWSPDVSFVPADDPATLVAGTVEEL